jgi:hypothetical protein
MECVRLIDQLPADPEPDSLFTAFASWAEERGLTLYPHQEEALIEVVSGSSPDPFASRYAPEGPDSQLHSSLA